jgi:hypothetical protein
VSYVLCVYYYDHYQSQSIKYCIYIEGTQKAQGTLNP